MTIQDIALNRPTYDLQICDGDLLLIKESDRVLQEIKINLWAWRGEWPLDITFGVPYIDDILIKAPDLLIVTQRIKAAILATNDVTEVISFDLDYDSDRILFIDAVVRSTYGNIALTEKLSLVPIVLAPVTLASQSFLNQPVTVNFTNVNNISVTVDIINSLGVVVESFGTTTNDNIDITPTILHDDVRVRISSVDFAGVTAVSDPFTVLFDVTTINWTANGDKGIYWDLEDGNVFQDAAGTIPALPGDVVGFVRDLSGNGNHMTQATTSVKPILRLDGSGFRYLECDGTTAMGLSTPALAPTDPEQSYTLIWSFHADLFFTGPSVISIGFSISASQRVTFQSSDGFSNNDFRFEAAPNVPARQAYVRTAYRAFPTNDIYVAEFDDTGDSFDSYLESDGLVQSQAYPSINVDQDNAVNFTGNSSGGTPGTTFSHIGKVYPSILIWQKLSAQDLTGLIQWVKQRAPAL